MKKGAKVSRMNKFSLKLLLWFHLLHVLVTGLVFQQAKSRLRGRKTKISREFKIANQWICPWPDLSWF